jgi:AcrR family transcriptional regulator
MEKTTEQLILETARNHFVQYGYGAARMQEIADEAGINKAMLHYYFRSKEKLYHEIVIQTLDFLLPRLFKAFKQEGTLFERIEHIIDTYIETLIEQPDIPFFVMSELSQKRERFIEELKKRSQHYPPVKSFLAQVSQEMQAGKIKQINPIHLFLNLLSMTVFPFIVKPVFCTLFDFSDDTFEQLMLERKPIIMAFIKAAIELR